MKEIMDAIDSRLKNPFFGYFIIALFTINWSQIFYLLVDDSSVTTRINYFQNATDIISLFILPFIAASAYSLLYPWLNYGFMWLCTKPNELKNELQANSEHKLIIKQQELEDARTKLLSSTENELIERAKRDAKLSEIKNKEVREKLESEIDSLRKERDKFRSSTKESSPPKTSSVKNPQYDEFQQYLDSGKLDDFIKNREMILTQNRFSPSHIEGTAVAKAFGLVDKLGIDVTLSNKGKKFFEWWILNEG